MALLSSSRPSGAETGTRRAWLAVPFGMAAAASGWWLTRRPPLPDAAVGGSGVTVSIALFDDSGKRLQTAQVRKLVKSEAEWRSQLGAEAFAVTRRHATEFAFQNKYWDNHAAGLYRCVCCGNAVFTSRDKFDSGTGWPSFSAPLFEGNVAARTDRSFGMERVEVVCAKCDAHLGHLFDDGPAPSYRRYCLNSAALRFVASA